MRKDEVDKVCRQIREATRRIIAEGRAREFLVKLGTHTPEGELTPEYGGPKSPGGDHEQVQNYII